MRERGTGFLIGFQPAEEPRGRDDFVQHGPHAMTRPVASGVAFPRLEPPCRSVLELVGQTPMVELTRFDTGRCRLFVKLESQNPGGSIKDRIALSMIADAEKRGLL